MNKSFPWFCFCEEIGDLAFLQGLLMVCRVFFLGLTAEESTVAHSTQASFSQFGQSTRQFPHHAVDIPAGMRLRPLELFKCTQFKTNVSAELQLGDVTVAV